MADLRKIYETVIENPGDHEFAFTSSDEFEEEGHGVRAEFIRVQTALSQLWDKKNWKDADRENWKNLKAQEKKLLQENREAWAWDDMQILNKRYRHLGT